MSRFKEREMEQQRSMSRSPLINHRQAGGAIGNGFDRVDFIQANERSFDQQFSYKRETIGIFATLAQHERELISSRTRAALQAKIAKGATLGKPENLTAEAGQKGADATRHNALANIDNRRALSVADMMYEAGKNYTQIANHLNSSGFKTARGCQFQATQVMRLIKRVVKV